jgi:hypothetical protein
MSEFKFSVRTVSSIEVAIRLPRYVVVISRSVSRSTRIPGKICWYSGPNDLGGIADCGPPDSTRDHELRKLAKVATDTFAGSKTNSLLRHRRPIVHEDFIEVLGSSCVIDDERRVAVCLGALIRPVVTADRYYF